jgi:hypothetical protein
MEALLLWGSDNWFSIVQTLGIVLGLLFTAASFCKDGQARQLSNLLAMAERHRSLWSELQKCPELSRILKKKVDLSNAPTLAEREFLNLIIIHFETGWRVAKTTDREELKNFKIDVGEFFSLPLPRAVWEMTKTSHNPQFAGFVEQAIERRRRGYFQ